MKQDSYESFQEGATWPIKEKADFEKEKFEDIEWVKPTTENARNEMGEVGRVVQEVLGVPETDPEYPKKVEELAKVLLGGEYQELSEEIWSKLENTDSYKSISFGDVQKVKDYAAGHGRDADALLGAIAEKKSIVAPAIFYHDGRYYLVAGNTRLMVARATGKRPMVVIAKLPQVHGLTP